MRLTVEVPKNLSAEQKRLLREFDGTAEDKNYQKSRSFRDKMKKIFGSDD